MLNINSIMEFLSEQLPVQDRPFANSKPFKDVCFAFYDFLKAPKDERDDAKEKLYHFKRIFDTYCTWERKRSSAPKLDDLGWGSMIPKKEKEDSKHANQWPENHV